MTIGGVCRTSASLPPRPRKALTVIEEFNLLVDKRAVEREEFDKKVTKFILFLRLLLSCCKYEMSILGASNSSYTPPLYIQVAEKQRLDNLQRERLEAERKVIFIFMFVVSFLTF